MREIVLPLVVVSAYVGVLVAVAIWAERRQTLGRSVTNRWIYSLALAAYATTWTFYGSVGFAARTGLLFLTVYLGPTLCAALWWWVLRKLVRIRNAHRITSLADLLSLRYEKSQAVAALATGMLVTGLVPYVALQIKTMIATLSLVAGPDLVYPSSGVRLGPPLVGLMLVFTVAFGLRRLRPTERHPGMVVALAVESIVKLVAFVVAGAFVTYGLFRGFGDVFRAAADPALHAPDLLGGHGVGTWLAHLLLSGFAILLLPRQFHLAVVESSDEDHVRTAMWLLPAYLLAINVFVLPMALGALALQGSALGADTFVLGIPLSAGRPLLSWLVFLGGFSAGTGMIVVETTALATMISNHAVFPAADAWRPLRRLRRHLLPTRWAAAALVLLAAFAYERAFGPTNSLASIGFVSFAAVLQLAPALMGGLFWRGASRVGALAGLAAGFATWAYTLVVPVLARSGWLPASILTEGPFGIESLVPEGLFDVHTEPVTHAVLWSLVANLGAFLAGSILFPPRAEEVARAMALVDPVDRPAPPPVLDGAPPIAPVAGKRARAIELVAAYDGAERAPEIVDGCLARAGVRPGHDLTALQLADLQSGIEATLAAEIGASAAHAAVRRARLVEPPEAPAISRAYAEILAGLDVSPDDLRRKIDYHRERERLLVRDAENQRFLAGVSELLAASLDVDATARNAVRLPVPHLADAALLGIEPAPSAPWHAWFAHRDPARDGAGAAAAAAAAAALATAGPVARALGTGRATSSRPVDPAAWPALISPALPLGAQLTVPLTSPRGALGALTLLVDDPDRLRAPEELALVDELARRLGIAVENARLYREAAEAVRARDEFLAVASHELKTPLGPLRLRIQTLERLVARGDLGSVPPEKLAQIFGGAEGQVLRMAELVDDLLDVTRLTTKRLELNLERFDLAAVVADVVEHHRSAAHEAECTVRVVAPGPVVGAWDRLRLEQVLANLLTNAFKYAAGSAVEVNVHGERSRARIVVRDEGPGIAATDRDRIFRPFERGSVRTDVAGFGLGLFIVRQIVEAHGGAVRVEAAPGRGTSFVVDLPSGATDGGAAAHRQV